MAPKMREGGDLDDKQIGFFFDVNVLLVMRVRVVDVAIDG